MESGSPVVGMTEPSRSGIWAVTNFGGHCDATDPMSGSISLLCVDSPRHRRTHYEHWELLKLHSLTRKTNAPINTSRRRETTSANWEQQEAEVSRSKYGWQ